MNRFCLMVLLILLLSCQNSDRLNDNSKKKNSLELKPSIGTKIMKEK